MQVFRLSDAHKSDDPLRAHMAQLIAVVGTPRFETTLFQAAHSVVNCEHVTAFAMSKNAGPRLLLAANVGSAPIARPTAHKYLAHYWQLDPANRMDQLCKDDSVALQIMPDADIQDELYRHDCYTSLHLGVRFTLMQRYGQNIYRMSFYAAGCGGRFGQHEIDHIVSSSDLLMSLIIKNDATGATASEAMLPQVFTNRLHLVAPQMPAREAEVCTSILLGMTSEAIALKLGISVNTVLTYRKRAYNRLNISCQNELMRLILA